MSKDKTTIHTLELVRGSLDVLLDCVRQQEVTDATAYARGSRLEGRLVDAILDDPGPDRPAPDLPPTADAPEGRWSMAVAKQFDRDGFAHARKPITLELTDPERDAARDALKERIAAKKLKQSFAGGVLADALGLGG